MSPFGLVHGGGFGAWCWERMIPDLEKLGHAALTVDLTPDDQASGAADCADVVSRAFAAGEDLVLVGHSLAGLIIPLVVERRPVSRLIFLHALLPRPGQSVVDQLRAEPDMFNPDMFKAAAPFWEDEGVATRFLLHDCPAELSHEAFDDYALSQGCSGEKTPHSASGPMCQAPTLSAPATVRPPLHGRDEPLASDSAWSRWRSRAATLRSSLVPCSLPEYLQPAFDHRRRSRKSTQTARPLRHFHEQRGGRVAARSVTRKLLARMADGGTKRADTAMEPRVAGSGYFRTHASRQRASRLRAPREEG